MRSRQGAGRHRQVWHQIVCPVCEGVVEARRTVPGKPWHIKAHYDSSGELCIATTIVASYVVHA